MKSFRAQDVPAALGALGGSLLIGRTVGLAGGPWLSLLAGACALGLAGGAWWLTLRFSRRWDVSDSDAGVRSCAGVPLLPWLMAWPALGLSFADPLAEQQIAGAAPALSTYLVGVLAAGAGGALLWSHALSQTVVRTDVVAGGGREALPGAGWPLAATLLAIGVTAYWNGAVLDPLQFRGFPDYVTQMGGARKLLAGELPYDPTIRVWMDVNLPPITLLLIFAPFTIFPDLTGRVLYFLLNHAAFLAGLALLLFGQAGASSTQPHRPLWVAAIAALALAFEPWHDSQRLGQQNGIVFLFIALAAVAAQRRQETLSGVALAVALIGKPSSALLGLYFLFARRWRAALAAAVTGIALFLVTLPWAGVENWRFYLLEKAPEILAGTPQQSNVALLAFHARLFLPLDVLASFDAMPDIPVAQAMTRVAQLLGAYALWRLVRRRERRDSPVSRYLEFCFALVLSLSLVGHAWQSYVTWLVVAFVPFASGHLWGALSPGTRWMVGALAAASYAALSINDVTLHRVVGSTSPAAAVFAGLPSIALIMLAFVVALLLAAYERNATETS